MLFFCLAGIIVKDKYSSPSLVISFSFSSSPFPFTIRSAIMERPTKKQRLLLPKEDSFATMPQTTAPFGADSTEELSREARQLRPTLLPFQVAASAEGPQAARRQLKRIPKSEADWSRVRELVIKYHIDGDQTLKDVIQTTEDELGFDVK